MRRNFTYVGGSMELVCSAWSVTSVEVVVSHLLEFLALGAKCEILLTFCTCKHKLVQTASSFLRVFAGELQRTSIERRFRWATPRHMRRRNSNSERTLAWLKMRRNYISLEYINFSALIISHERMIMLLRISYNYFRGMDGPLHMQLICLMDHEWHRTCFGNQVLDTKLE